MKKRNNGNGGHAKRGAKAINESLNKRLAVYALMAGAAGVGALALAVPAEASIVTGTGTPITINSTHNPETLTIVGSHALIFSFSLAGNALRENAPNAQVQVNPAVLTYNGRSAVEVLSGGALIGPGQKFLNFANLGGFVTSSGAAFFLPWNGRTGDLGFKFMSKGNSYFGWAKMTFSANGKSAKLTEFAYEACPNVAIGAGVTSGGASCAPTTTPEPGTLTLFLLALGAVGLVELRRRRVAPAASGS